MTEATPAATAIKDARPILPRGDNIWERADRRRDEVHDAFEAACAQAGIDALIIKSRPYTQPPFVRFECWLRGDNAHVTARTVVVVRVVVRPFHRYELLHEVEVNSRGWRKTWRNVIELNNAHAAELVKCAVTGERPRPKYSRIRQVPWQFWRPKNKIDLVRGDWLAIGSAMAVFSSFYLAMAGMESHNNDVVVAAILLFLGGVVVIATSRLRARFVLDGGQPNSEPRVLRPYDAWQTVLFGMGEKYADFRKRLQTRITEGGGTRFKSAVEKIWYWGLDGKEERTQLVISHRRGLLFLQVYAYGEDLYVGWDAHLNAGAWMEKPIAFGIRRGTGRPVTVNIVTQAVQPLTEYDYIDANALAEWAHAQVVKQVREFVGHHKIDQEIDFKIIRAGQRGVGEAEQEKKPAGGVFSRMKRTD